MEWSHWPRITPLIRSPAAPAVFLPWYDLSCVSRRCCGRILFLAVVSKTHEWEATQLMGLNSKDCICFLKILGSPGHASKRKTKGLMNIIKSQWSVWGVKLTGKLWKEYYRGDDICDVFPSQVRLRSWLHIEKNFLIIFSFFLKKNYHELLIRSIFWWINHFQSDLWRTLMAAFVKSNRVTKFPTTYLVLIFMQK